MPSKKTTDEIEEFWKKHLIPESNPTDTGIDWFINYFRAYTKYK